MISLRKLFQQTFEDHKGRPGKQGGSLPRGSRGAKKKKETDKERGERLRREFREMIESSGEDKPGITKEEGTSGTHYHSTKLENVDNILKEGIVSNNSKRLYAKLNPKLYSGKENAVFVSNSYDGADRWGYWATNGDSPYAVIEIDIPSDIVSEKDTNPDASSSDFMIRETIKPEWIKKVTVHPPREKPYIYYDKTNRNARRKKVFLPYIV